MTNLGKNWKREGGANGEGPRKEYKLTPLTGFLVGSKEERLQSRIHRHERGRENGGKVRGGGDN